MTWFWRLMTAWFRREPAQAAATVAALVQLAFALIVHPDVAQQGLIGAVTAALSGLLVALAVAREKAAAALSGLVGAVLALAVSFGLALDPSTQASIMAFVGAAGAMWLRTQVEAKQPDPSVYP